MTMIEGHYAVGSPCYQRTHEQARAERVRFWDELNGSPVKITLLAGQSVSRTEERITEEGYDDVDVTISFDGYEIVKVSHRYGRDCDGSFSHQWTEKASGIYKNIDGETFADYGVAK